MATVDKITADKIIAGKFKGDKPTRIVKYNNMFDGREAYGVTFGKQDKNLYFQSGACVNPVLYWDITEGYKET